MTLKIFVNIKDAIRTMISDDPGVDYIAAEKALSDKGVYSHKGIEYIVSEENSHLFDEHGLLGHV